MFFFIFQFVKLFAHKVGITFYAGPFTGQTAVSEIIPNLLLLQSWLPFADHASFNGPSWSISIEFYMYALLFLTIVGFRKYKVLSWFGISLLALLLMYCKSEVILSAVLRGLSCFFGGAFTYTVYKKVSHYQPRFIIGSFIEVLLIFFVIYVVQSNIEHRSIIAPVLFFITVLFFAFESGIVSTLFKLNPLQQMGKLSYSIYMVHAGILYCVGILAILIEKFIGVEARVKIADVTYLTFGDEVVNNIVFAFILLLVIYVSNLTYKYIEIPGQALNKR
jgi:peptidoglycan/LPS O-acetylase OafA/YrhL